MMNATQAAAAARDRAADHERTIRSITDPEDARDHAIRSDAARTLADAQDHARRAAQSAEWGDHDAADQHAALATQAADALGMLAAQVAAERDPDHPDRIDAVVSQYAAIRTGRRSWPDPAPAADPESDPDPADSTPDHLAQVAERTADRITEIAPGAQVTSRAAGPGAWAITIEPPSAPRPPRRRRSR